MYVQFFLFGKMFPSKMNVYKQYFFILLLYCLLSELVNCLNYPNAHMCCKESGILSSVDQACIYNGFTANISLYCESGQYTIDKELDEIDNYTIVGDELFFYKIDTIVPYDGYCLGEAIDDDDERHEIGILCAMTPSSKDNTLFKGIMAFISVAFLCATLYVYKIIPQLRETQDKVTIFCISCLAIGFTCLGSLQILPGYTFENTMCAVMGFLIYFFLIAYFSWLNMVTANVLKAVVFPRWQIKEKIWYILNHIYAWAVPIVLTVVLLAAQFSDIAIHPGIGHETCSIKGESLWLYLYTPLTIMIVANFIQFIIISITLYKFSNDLLSSSRKRALRYKCQLYFKLFILSGMTWIFELISYLFKQWTNVWLITDAINALHGILVFLILIVFRKRIRRELAGKQICCFHIPHEWNKIGDSEGMGSEETKQDNINIRSQINESEP